MGRDLTLTPSPDCWNVRLNPTQQIAYESLALYILLTAEKACRPLDTQIYLADGLARLGTLKPSNAVSGFTETSIPVCAFDGKKVVHAVADAYWIEPDKKSLTAELQHGGLLTGSDRHPIWASYETPEKESGFRYFKLSEIAALKPQGWRFWTPLIGHPNWSSKKYETVSALYVRKTCWLCDRKPIARGLCANHYESHFKRRGEQYSKHEPKTVVINEDLAYVLGALTGDGSINNLNHSATFTNIDPECIDQVSKGCLSAGMKLCKLQRYAFSIRPLDVARQILRSIGLEGLSYDKRIPDKIISSPKSVVASFLSGLFDTDGTVDKAGNVQYCTTSEKLGLDVQDTLAAFGILCVRRSKKSASGNPTWTLSINGRHAVAFKEAIGFRILRKQNRILGARISKLCPSGFNHNRYSYPKSISSLMRKVACTSAISRSNDWHNKHAHLRSYKSVPSREKVAEFCEIYKCRDKFEDYLVSDNWLEVVGVTESTSELADLRVPGPHSFLASGTINHNSGKSWVGLNALVRHCYEEKDALALIIAPALRSGKEGVFTKLEAVLDIWKNGNIDPHGNRIDQGLGDSFESTLPTLDPQTKDKIIKIRNVHGGWSKVMLISIPWGADVEKRMRGLEPSFVYVDEITLLQNASYFTYVTLQLGRRPGIRGPQQYYASCNPEGPSHWVYKEFIEGSVDDDGNPNPDFLVLHIPVEENKEYLQPGYLDRIKNRIKDPTEYKRLIEGQWIDRPSGDAIFKDEFKPEHVRPMIGTEEARKGAGLQPHPGIPIFVGYDPGPRNYCISFMQMIPTKDGKNLWIVFDELILVGQRRPDFWIAAELLKKMDFWQKQTRGISPFIHVADQSAFTHVRHDGNYDATRMKALTKGRVVMRPFMSTDKDSKGSVAARIGMVRNALVSGCLFVSATCPRHIDALNLLASEKRKDGEYDDMEGLRPKRSPYLHPFDSMSYPMFYTQLMPSSFVPQTGVSSGGVFRAGRG